MLFLAGLSIFYLADFDRKTSRLEIDPSIKNLAPDVGQEVDIYRHSQETFENDDYLLVIWQSEDLFSSLNLKALKVFSRKVESLPGVIKVDSLASAMRVKSESETTFIGPFLETIPSDDEGLSLIKKEATENPLLRGQIVSNGGDGALVLVHFDQSLTSLKLSLLIQEIREISEREAKGMKQFITGPLYTRIETGRVLIRDLHRVLPTAVFVTFFVAFVGFRNIKRAALPVLCNIFTLLITLSLFVHFGHTLNFVTALLPAVIYVVGFAYAIHVVAEFEHNWGYINDKKEALELALKQVFLPITLTALTTALGFGSLILSDIGAIKIFGIYAALGTVVSWLASLTVVPAGLWCFNSSRMVPIRRTSSVSMKVASFVDQHHKQILVIGFSLFFISVVGTSQISVSTNYLDNFNSDNVIHENFDLTNSLFSGAVPVQILLRAPYEDAFKEPSFLKVIENFQHRVEMLPSVGGVYSIVDYLNVLESAFAEEIETDPELPRSKSLNSALLLFGGGVDADRYVDPSFQETILRVKTSAIATKDLTALVAVMQSQVDELELGITGHVTGSSSIIARTIDNIARGQVLSIFVALVSIYIVLWVLFRSWRLATIALIPNALPLSVFFGYLALSGTPLSMTTSMVASVVLGIAIDDSIHFLTRFKREYAASANSRYAIEKTLGAVGRPVTLTTAALCAGFLTLSVGELQNQLEFGILASGSLLLAWLIDVTFTPALCLFYAEIFSDNE